MDPGAGFYALEKRKIFCCGLRGSFTRSTTLSWSSATHFHISPLLVSCPIRLADCLGLRLSKSGVVNLAVSDPQGVSEVFQVVQSGSVGE